MQKASGMKRSRNENSEAPPDNTKNDDKSRKLLKLGIGTSDIKEYSDGIYSIMSNHTFLFI